MALILYTCDTCKRTISKPQNPRGLEVVNRCVITLGCRGQMYQSDVLEDFVRGGIPPDVVGLDNWQQRRVLFDYTQFKLDTTWKIEHNLGTVPVVSIFVNQPTSDNPNNQVEITPEQVVIVDSDNIEVLFATPQSGIAQLVARSSDPQLFQPNQIIEPDIVTIQTSNQGELTVATRVDSVEPTNIQIQLVFITPTGIEVPITYDLDDIPSSRSPWVTSNRVLIRGKIFHVRSFNPIGAVLLSGIVPENSTVRIIGFNSDVNFNAISPIREEQIYILLASDPFQPVDVIRTSAIDTVVLSSPSATTQMVYTDGELFVTPSTLIDIHPNIRSL